jgi:hypothetical protein
MDTLARNTSLSVFVAVKSLANAQKMSFNLKTKDSQKLGERKMKINGLIKKRENGLYNLYIKSILRKCGGQAR